MTFWDKIRSTFRYSWRISAELVGELIDYYFSNEFTPKNLGGLEVTMKMKLFLILVANLFFGNLGLYFHEIYGRHQSEVATNLCVSFSLVSIILLLVAARILKTKKSIMTALILSLIISFLVPLIGFYVAMWFSLVALFYGSLYLFYGFLYLILPMWILNSVAFRWIQKSTPYPQPPP
jgi:hypothetical protein